VRVADQAVSGETTQKANGSAGGAAAAANSAAAISSRPAVHGSPSPLPISRRRSLVRRVAAEVCGTRTDAGQSPRLRPSPWHQGPWQTTSRANGQAHSSCCMDSLENWSGVSCSTTINSGASPATTSRAEGIESAVQAGASRCVGPRSRLSCRDHSARGRPISSVRGSVIELWAVSLVARVACAGLGGGGRVRRWISILRSGRRGT